MGPACCGGGRGGGGCATERLALSLPASLRGKQGSKVTQQTGELPLELSSLLCVGVLVMCWELL